MSIIQILTNKYFFFLQSSLSHCRVTVSMKYLHHAWRLNHPFLYQSKYLKYSAGLISQARSECRSLFSCEYKVGNAIIMYLSIWNSLIGILSISSHIVRVMLLCIQSRVSLIATFSLCVRGIKVQVNELFYPLHLHLHLRLNSHYHS